MKAPPGQEAQRRLASDSGAHRRHSDINHSGIDVSLSRTHTAKCMAAVGSQQHAISLPSENRV